MAELVASAPAGEAAAVLAAAALPVGPPSAANARPADATASPAATATMVAVRRMGVHEALAQMLVSADCCRPITIRRLRGVGVTPAPQQG